MNKNQEFLKMLRPEWKYIARDKNGQIGAYKVKPPKESYYWGGWGFDFCPFSEELLNINFNFIKWSDKEPRLIEDLIEK